MTKRKTCQYIKRKQETLSKNYPSSNVLSPKKCVNWCFSNIHDQIFHVTYYIQNTETNGKLVNTFNKGTITLGSNIRNYLKNLIMYKVPFMQDKIPR